MLPTYTPLAAETAEVRILNLLPGQPSDPVQCTLQVVSLNNPPEYEALSYVWGDATLQRRIVVDGHSVNVTASLESALRALRKGDVAHTMWADALCINQEDVLEKNVYVPLMGRVYAIASSVAVWLGECNPDIEFAIKWLLKQETASSQAKIYGDLEEERLMSGVLSLLHHPYWTRMWTYQEFRLSKEDPVLIHGKQRLSSRLLKGIIDFSKVDQIIARESDVKLRDLRLSLPFTMSEFNRNYWRENIPSFTGLLSSTALRECEDPRDHIYALYGIMPEVAEDLPPKYDAPPKQVMYNTAAYLIRREDVRLGRLLMYYCLYEDRLFNTDLPSWIPDFSAPLMQSESEHQFSAYDPLSYRLSEGTTLELSADTRVLKLRARVLGECKVRFRFSHESSEIVFQVHQHTISGSGISGLTNGKATNDLSTRWLARIISAQTTNPNKITADEIQRKLLKLKTSQAPDDAFVQLLLKLRGKSIFETMFDNIGISVADVEDGDVVVTCPPFDRPLVLRSQGPDRSEKVFRLVGLSYIDGAMEVRDAEGRYVDEEWLEHVMQQELTTFCIE